MTCCYCKAHAKKFGKFRTANGSVERYRCLSCGKTFKADGPLGDMRLGGHFKTGQWWSPQKRPMGMARDSVVLPL